MIAIYTLCVTSGNKAVDNIMRIELTILAYTMHMKSITDVRLCFINRISCVVKELVD